MNYSEYAKQFIGVTEKSPTFRTIIDTYNTLITPLPRGYKMKYTDNWCAAFVSVILKECTAINAPYECSCYYMLHLASKQEQLVTRPAENDLVLYDWNHDGIPDHVGIVENIIGNTLTVIEGNKNNAVGTRIIRENSKNILTYIRVRQDYTQIAKDVIAGAYGNGEQRKKALGSDYEYIQHLVNTMLK